MNNFRVGQKVVCISHWKGGYRKGGYLHVPDTTFPKYGHVYVIDGFQDYGWAVGVFVCGFRDAYDINGFRPAVDKPCDISVFQRMLTPTDLVSA